jgi:hypothetical protein
MDCFDAHLGTAMAPELESELNMKKYAIRNLFWRGIVLSLVAACGESKAAPKSPAAIPWNRIGAAAGADYNGDGLSVAPIETGARLHCVFQRLDGEATPEGLWLSSTVTNTICGRFRVTATGIGRKPTNALDAQRPGCNLELWAGGGVSIKGQTVRFTRPGLTEEYSVSMDGVRQDFIVEQAPPGPPTGELVVELAVTGAKVEEAPYGATLVLENSGRKIAYSRLRVTDAKGRLLPAHIEISGRSFPPPNDSSSFDIAMPPLESIGSAQMLAVAVDDSGAAYPVRIDPTFSDDNWVSMGYHLGANGLIYAAVADAAGNLYIGGPAGNSLASVSKWNGSSWSGLGSGMNSPVYALAVSGSDLYAGGWFTMADGNPANYIARWNGSNWLPLGSGMNGYVYALAISGGTLYAGGDFSKADGNQVNGIAQWNGTSWSSLGVGMGGTLPYVRALAVSGTNLYAGGFFTIAGGEVTNANYIARWDGAHWSALDSGMNGRVLSLAASGSTLYAGGNFTSAGDVTNANHVAKWDGIHWSALGSGTDGAFVSALAISGNALYAGGQFTKAGGTNVHSIAQWNGTTWISLGPGLDNPVNALVMSGNTLYAVGNFDFTSDSVVALSGVGQWNGTNWSALGPGMNSVVFALAASGSTLYAGGYFTTAGDVTNANYVAQWDGTHWSGLGSGVNAGVFALAVSGGTLYVGGGFTKAGGSNAFYIAQWNGTNWSALGPGLSLAVNALTVSGGKLYAGGQFKNPRGNTSVHLNGIAQWDGSSWSPLGSGMSGTSPYVTTFAVSGSTLYAGGNFTNAGGTAAKYVAQWDGTNWSALGSGVGSKIIADRPSVSALAVSGDKLYVGGFFTLAGGSDANYIAQWDGNNWSAVGSGVGGFSPAVSALAVSGGSLYVAGSFTTAGGNPANYIAQWDGNGWSPLGSGMDRAVNALAISGSTLYVGGDFFTAGGRVSAYAAMASLGVSVPVITQDAAFGFTNGVFGFNVTGPAGAKLVIDYSANLRTWIPLQTNLLGNGPVYFSDPQSTVDQQRYYRPRLLP